MSSLDFPELEPFGETRCTRDSGHSNEMITFGYRVVGTDTILAAIEVPLSVAQKSVPRKLMANLSPNGTIAVSLELNEFSGRTDFKEISLVQLVEELLEPYRLCMEEIEMSDLEVLLRSLGTSIQLIGATMTNSIARLKKTSSPVAQT